MPGSTHRFRATAKRFWGDRLAEKRRLLWPDIAKGVGIILVVFGHVWRGANQAGLLPNEPLFVLIDNAIYLFHMPLFFVLAALFFERSARRDGFLGGLRTRAVTLLYPLLLWSYITALFLIIAGGLTNRPAISFTEALLFPFPPKDIYWFLWALFLIQTFASALVLLAGSIPAYLAAFAISVAIVSWLDISVAGPWFIDAIARSPFFFLGLLLATPLRSVVGNIPALILGLVFFVGAQVLTGAWGTPGSAFWSLVLAATATVGIIMLIAAGSTFLPALVARPLERLGQASMAIYVAHILAASGTRIVLLKFGIDSLAIHLVAGTLAGIGLPYLMLKLVEHSRWRVLLGLGKPPSTSPQERSVPASV